jgi:transposase
VIHCLQKYIGGHVKKKGRKTSMKKLKEIARLLLECNLGIRSIARACNISTSTASVYAEKFRELGATYQEICGIDEDTLTDLLSPVGERVPARALPDFAYLAGELKKKGVTLQLLHEEYKKDNPDGYEKSRFYQLYHDWRKKADPVMRFTHKAGEKMFVDFSGDKPRYQNPATGEMVEAELFVSVLGASSYIFAYAVRDQTKESFVDCNIRALEYYGGCPECLIIDNLKAGVTHACYYDPEINRTLAAMAEHYNIAVIPTRVARPKDKAKVENAVLQVQRRIMASLRNGTFFGLSELNEAILVETDRLNNRPMAGIGRSRHDLFIEIEKPVFKPLPEERFVIASWKKAKVHIDYHVQVEKVYYSAPYTLIGEYVDIRYTGSVVEIYHKGRRVASHMRAHKPGAFVTEDLHMPMDHRQYLEWTPARIRVWGEKIGSHTRSLMEAIMEHKTHPEQGFRSCLGIIRLARAYSCERVDNACRRALEIGAYNYRSVKSLLETGLDNTIPSGGNNRIIALHSNIRGNEYYREVNHD